VRRPPAGVSCFVCWVGEGADSLWLNGSAAENR